MKQKSTNATVTYEPEVVAKDLKVTFTKVTSVNGSTLYGKVDKNGEECGSISYNEKDGYLITNLRALSRFTPEEIKAIHAKVPEWLDEVFSEAEAE